MGTIDTVPERHLLRVERRPDSRVAMPEWLTDIPAVRQVLDDGWEIPPGVTVLIGENGDRGHPFTTHRRNARRDGDRGRG